MHINKLLHPNQYGFTHGTSATKALYELKETIDEIEKEGRKAIIISLDISNALNTVWIPFVLAKLKDHRLSRNLYILLKNILRERKRKYEVVADNIHINSPIESPQGFPSAHSFGTSISRFSTFPSQREPGCRHSRTTSQ